MRTTSFRHQRIAGRALLRTQGGAAFYGRVGQTGWSTLLAIVNDRWSGQDPDSDAGMEFSTAKIIALVHVDDVPEAKGSVNASQADRMMVDGVTYQVTAARPHKMGLWKLALDEPGKEWRPDTAQPRTRSW